jgi:hypothetical protein
MKEEVTEKARELCLKCKCKRFDVVIAVPIGADLGKILGSSTLPSPPLFNGVRGYNPGKILEITDACR